MTVFSQETRAEAHLRLPRVGNPMAADEEVLNSVVIQPRKKLSEVGW